MKYNLFFVFTLLAFCLNAQIDSENKSIIIPAQEVEDPKADNELIIMPEEKNSAEPDKEEENEIVLPKKEKLPVAERKEFSMIKENKFRNPAELYQKQLKNALKLRPDEERKHNGSEVTQYLGEYSTKAKRVNIIYRDHQAEDGDIIRVYVNGNIAQSRVLLQNHSKGFFLTLEPGDNIIEFEALNQGTSGPNTAEFQVLDDSGKAFITNQWNLATGVKATITVVKAKDEE
ncbi:hypothetical protein CLV86_0238 [Lacinutrix venerupis]|uniref:Secreted protein n=1 Tax=Lacinutrix venerupis TaxID=1486034 RepID=A0AAC9PWQ6_9FLAO|nr:hypothetical protein [Lacinutrix venerupis]APY00326.1 hypothetical protein BWR22_08360 [Lacinutrix venerupis]RLJ68849.1 hypothetical protein CLV86_0238 [Lacinutrix venerupis]